MSSTPFRDTAQQVADRLGSDYAAMQVHSDRARSHAWWRNVVNHGAWAGPAGTRVGPPDPESIPGIAQLFGTTEEQVQSMIAADWYGVVPDGSYTAQTQRIAANLENLAEDDRDLVEGLVARFAR